MSINRRIKFMVLPLAFMFLQTNMQAQSIIQKQSAPESFGNTLNLGVGPGYFGYLGVPAPFFFANYEFDVLRNFTLAPFIGITSYRSDAYYYHNNDYYYRETVIPIGVKGTYYFDELLGANPNWDFYAAASLGFAIDNVRWDDSYTGDRGVAHTANPLYLDVHIGAEYHVSHKVGLFLDLSTGVSTFGVAFHHL
ncbi:MAG: hypothetical protein P4L41_13785 [Flavipsychrobacter sp.]|nr:hypothetical protein [Flavipsychrobacter sp.]